MSRQIAVIGLGLIGGSIAMGLKEFEDFKRVGVDVSQPTLRYALEQGIVDQVCEDPREALAQADLVFLCMHPRGIQEFLSEHRDHFRPGSLVTDVCGVKGAIVDAARTLPSSVSFLGGHPMAGTEFSGIQHALPNMFQGAHYILTPDEGTQPEHLALMERVARHLGCADVVRTTPEQHDAIIAYTSQMMHIIAVSVCDDPSLFAYQGFEGDSFRGCTRVAALDVGLWTQLFSMNSPALLTALERLAAPALWLKLTGLPGLSLGGVPPMPEPSLGAPVDPAWESTLFIEDFSLDWWWWPAILLLALVFGLIIGAVMQRFGARGAWGAAEARA